MPPREAVSPFGLGFVGNGFADAASQVMEQRPLRWHPAVQGQALLTLLPSLDEANR